VANCGTAVEFLHDVVVFLAVIELERLDHRADLAIGIEQFFALGIISREARGKLAAILQIQQKPRHQTGNLTWVDRLQQRRRRGVGEMINRGDPAFVLHLVHKNLRKIIAGVPDSR
jgi:hypothetical protein